MPQHIIIVTDSAAGLINGATVTDRNSITTLLQAKGWLVWHWFQDMWLVIVDSPERIPLTPLREEITALIGSTKHVLLFNIADVGTHTGMGPPAGWIWMKENWGKTE